MFNYTELPNSIKGVDLGKKYDKRHLKQNSLHGWKSQSLRKKKKNKTGVYQQYFQNTFLDNGDYS